MELLKKLLLLFLALFFIISSAQSQQAYWVFFTDKEGVNFDPYTYFDQKAIDRRIRNDIPLNHSSDWPLNESYVMQVTELIDSAIGQTRWFNAVAVLASPEQLIAVKKLSFVKQIQPMIYYSVLANAPNKAATTDKNANKRNQLESMEYSVFKEADIDGKGVRIAIFDAGFPGVRTSQSFAKIMEEERLIKTWDFTKNKEDVFYSIQHGTNVMSNIGGVDKQKQAIGMATGAEFLLAKTEGRREPYSEEKNWLAAVEWADKNGADIINSSLIRNTPDGAILPKDTEQIYKGLCEKAINVKKEA